VDLLYEHQKKFLDDILALDQINFLNEYRRTNQVSGGDHLRPMKTEFSRHLLILKPVFVRNFPKALRRRKQGQRQQQFLSMHHHQ
jgi:hypothetical protein